MHYGDAVVHTQGYQIDHDEFYALPGGKIANWMSPTHGVMGGRAIVAVIRMSHSKPDKSKGWEDYILRITKITFKYLRTVAKILEEKRREMVEYTRPLPCFKKCRFYIYNTT